MRVVINMSLDGTIEVITDGPADVYSVCDDTPNDRVYRLTEIHMVSAAAVDAALRDDPVGHSGDNRHAAIEHRVLSAIVGDSHLKPVK
jgi:hypothetical protein